MKFFIYNILWYLDRSCDGIEVGRVTNNENPRLEELSGLAESNRFKDVFYSIEDSQNENVVYVINKNGTLRGMQRRFDHTIITQRKNKYKKILNQYYFHIIQ